MKRLTEKDAQGNWGLKGIRWEQLYEGQVITGEMREKLYSALWKLMEYEDTGMTPEEIEKLYDEQDKRRRAPMTERSPEKEITGWKKQIEWLKWNDDVEEYGEIECPMLENERVMTYYPKGCPCYYSYTAPFVDEDGDIGYYRYDHDEGCWDEDVFFYIGNR